MSQEAGGAEPKDWITRPEDVDRPTLDRIWLYKSAKTGRHPSTAGTTTSPNGWRVPWPRESGYRLQTSSSLCETATKASSCGGPPEAFAGDAAFPLFAGYLVFDAWIANTDRHAINWAVLERDGDRLLAPSFDHGSALASGVADADLARHDPAKFARGGMASRFENGKMRTLVGLALEAVDLGGPPAHRWLERVALFGLAQLDEVLSAAMNTMRLSVERRTFLEAVLVENQGRLTT